MGLENVPLWQSENQKCSLYSCGRFGLLQIIDILSLYLIKGLHSMYSWQLGSAVMNRGYICKLFSHNLYKPKAPGRDT